MMRPRENELFDPFPYYSKLIGALLHFMGPALVNQVGMFLLTIRDPYSTANSDLVAEVVGS